MTGDQKPLSEIEEEMEVEVVDGSDHKSEFSEPESDNQSEMGVTTTVTTRARAAAGSDGNDQHMSDGSDQNMSDGSEPWGANDDSDLDVS